MQTIASTGSFLADYAAGEHPGYWLTLNKFSCAGQAVPNWAKVRLRLLKHGAGRGSGYNLLMFSRAVNAVYLALLSVLLVFALGFPAQQFYKYDLLPPVDKQGTPAYIDFLNLYAAGHLVLDPATRSHVYEPEVQYKWQCDFLRTVKIKKVFYLQHVPFIFPLMVPFALLAPGPSFLIWTICSVLAAFAGLGFLNRIVPRSKRWFAAFAVGMFASLPCCFGLWLGQKSLALFFLLSLYWWAFSKGRDGLAGMALALASISPHYAIFLSLPALVHKRWKLIASAAGVELLLISLAGFTIGWHNVVNYPLILMKAETTGAFAGVNPQKQVCLRGLLSQFVSTDVALKASFYLMLAGLVLMLLLWLKEANQGERRFADSSSSSSWALSLTVLGSLLVSPHTHIHDWINLAVPAWLTLPTLALLSAGWLRSWSLRWWTILLLLYPVLSWLIYFMGLPQSTTIQWPALGLLALDTALLLLASTYYLCSSNTVASQRSAGQT